MAALLVLSLAGLVGGAGAATCSPANQCPRLSDHRYCPVNDVTEHGDVNRDVKRIKEDLASSPPNYTSAKMVYTNGMFSSKGNGNMRTLQGLALKDMTSSGTYTNTFYSGALALYGSSGISHIWDDYVVKCLDGTDFCAGKSDDFRRYVINKGLIGVVTAYVTYEMGAAVWKGSQGQTTDAGAAYAWDEAAAFYVGNIPPLSGDGFLGPPPGNLYSPYEFNWKRDDDFPLGVKTHTSAIPILNHGLLSLRGSAYIASAVAAAQTAMYKIFSIAAIRSAIKYSSKAHNGGNFQEKYLAEGWAYWRSASGYISTVNQTAVRAIDALLDLNLTSVSASAPCEIKALAESMYAGLGITCAMVGKWKDAASGSCLDSVCSDTGNSATLLGGSTAYLDTCAAPADASAAPAASRGAPLAAAFAAAAVTATCDFA